MPANTLDYILLLEREYPLTVFRGSCETYAKIKWQDTNIPKPSEAELLGRWGRLDVILNQESKIKELSSLCGADIEKGFYSSALGKPHFYDAGAEDQRNLIGSVADGKDMYYTCRLTPTAASSPIPHTISQLKQVMSDGKAFKQSVLYRYYALKGAVLEKTTITDIDKVLW